MERENLDVVIDRTLEITLVIIMLIKIENSEIMKMNLYFSGIKVCDDIIISVEVHHVVNIQVDWVANVQIHVLVSIDYVQR